MKELHEAEALFFSFRAGGIGYVVPLEAVLRVSAHAPAETPVVSFGGKPYCYLLVRGAQDVLALAIETAEGLSEIEPAHQFELPADAHSAENRCLAGVCLQNDRLYYLLDCSALEEAR